MVPVQQENRLIPFNEDNRMDDDHYNIVDDNISEVTLNVSDFTLPNSFRLPKRPREEPNSQQLLMIENNTQTDPQQIFNPSTFRPSNVGDVESLKLWQINELLKGQGAPKITKQNRLMGIELVCSKYNIPFLVSTSTQLRKQARK
jgi:hypothetical protein